MKGIEQPPQGGNPETWESLHAYDEKLCSLRDNVRARSKEVLGDRAGTKWFIGKYEAFLATIREHVPGFMTYVAGHVLGGSTIVEKMVGGEGITKKDFPGEYSLERHYHALLDELNELAELKQKGKGSTHN